MDIKPSFLFILLRLNIPVISLKPPIGFSKQRLAHSLVRSIVYMVDQFPDQILI